MLKINSIIQIIFFLLLSINVLNAQNSDFFSPENRLGFGNSLFAEKDYLRAIGEYKSYLQVENNDTVKFKMAFAFSQMGRYQEAEDNLKGLFFASKLSEEAKYEYIKALYFEKAPDRFREALLNSPFVPSKYSESVYRLKQISFLQDEYSLPDSTEIENLFSENQKIELMKFYLRKKNPDYKSPTTAALLSAIMPGLGKIYADEIGDGITSFLFTGVLGFLAYDNFRADHKFRAWLFTGLAAWFYGGNIYGSAAAAQNYNASIRFNFHNELNFYLNTENYFSPKYDFMIND